MNKLWQHIFLQYKLLKSDTYSSLMTTPPSLPACVGWAGASGAVASSEGGCAGGSSWSQSQSTRQGRHTETWNTRGAAHPVLQIPHWPHLA